MIFINYCLTSLFLLKKYLKTNRNIKKIILWKIYEFSIVSDNRLLLELGYIIIKGKNDIINIIKLWLSEIEYIELLLSSLNFFPKSIDSKWIKQTKWQMIIISFLN